MNFEEKFNQFIPELTEALTIPNSSDWTVKGFIDYHKNIYSISTDTKVVSKIIELMIFPKFLEFAQRNNLRLELAPHQNYYPDITFVDADRKKYAVDLKSTYRATATKVNGMTLGAFTGYFRNRSSSKNIGSETSIEKLKLGNGLFKEEFGKKGKDVFDSYWINYETKDMARNVGREKPIFNNINTYKEWIDSLSISK